MDSAATKCEARDAGAQGGFCRDDAEPGTRYCPGHRHHTALDDVAEIVAETGWIKHDGKVYVNADDLIALLRAADYVELAEDFERIAKEERHGQ